MKQWKHMVDLQTPDSQIWHHISERYLINRIYLLLEVIQKLSIIQNYRKEVLLVWSLWLEDWGWWQLVFTTCLKETRKEGLSLTSSLRWHCKKFQVLNQYRVQFSMQSNITCFQGFDFENVIFGDNFYLAARTSSRSYVTK